MKYTKLLWVADITFGKEARAQEKPIREGPTLSPGHNTYTARAIYDSDTTSIITPCSATTHNPEHKDIAEIPDRWYISQIVAVSVMWSGLGGASHQQNIKGQNRYMSVRVTTVLGFYPNSNMNVFCGWVPVSLFSNWFWESSECPFKIFERLGLIAFYCTHQPTNQPTSPEPFQSKPTLSLSRS